MKTETPETDQSWASWPYAGPGMSVHVGRKLERERDALRASIGKAVEELLEWQRISKAESERWKLDMSLSPMIRASHSGRLQGKSDAFGEAAELLASLFPASLSKMNARAMTPGAND